MNNRYKGDMLGEIDQVGIARWYPNCKVRKEGNVYIATPHTTNLTRRTVRKQQAITVSVTDGKYALEKPSDKPLNNNVIQAERSAEQTDKSPPKTDVRSTTLKQIFDELYDKYYKQYPYIRKQSILKDILPLFPSEEDAAYFVDEQCGRKWRNAYTVSNGLSIRHTTKTTNTFLR